MTNFENSPKYDLYKRIFKRYESGEKAVTLAKEFGISDTSVRNIARKFGMKPNQGTGKLTEAQRLLIFEIFEKEPLTTREIALRVGTSSGTVSKVLRGYFGVNKRSSNRSCMFTLEQCRAIARRYAEYETYAQLAREFECSTPTIGEALKRLDIQPRTGWSKFRTISWTDRKGRQLVFKSSWELKYAQRLDAANLNWDYEPTRYTLEVCRRYTPDFVITRSDNTVALVEIHGWLDQRTLNKLIEFCTLYPAVTFRLLGPTELANMGLVESYYKKHAQGLAVTKAARYLKALKTEQTLRS